MKKILLAFLFCVAALNAQAPLLIVVPIQNPSFTQGQSGWQFGPSSRVEVVNGTPVALAGYGGKFSQDLGVKPQFGVYTLKVSVANDFYSYPGPYEATISIGTKEFCSTYGWAVGAFTEVTLTCPVSNYFTIYNGYGFDASKHLVISFQANGWPVLFNNVSLTFTPDKVN